MSTVDGQTMHVVLGVSAGVLVLLGWVVAWPLARIFAEPTALLKEWTELPTTVSSLERGVLDEPGCQFTDTTKQALRTVLGRAAGFGRLRNVPLALEILAAPADFKARHLRILSTQAIVVGLLGTALTFALLFPSLDAPEQLFAAVRDHLGLIYAINALCIVVAIVLMVLHRREKEQGDRVYVLASRAFAQLEESGDDVIGPELARTLERVAEEFKQASSHLALQQFQRTEGLMGEIKVLGEMLSTLVRQVADSSSADQQQFLESVVIDQRARNEQLIERLDAGFKLLAQPFLQGIPAMQAMHESSAALSAGVQQVLQTNIFQVATQLKLSVAQLDRTMRELPDVVAKGTSEAGDAARLAIATAIESQFGQVRELSDTLADQVGQLRASLDVIPRQIADDRRASNEELRSSIATSARDLAASLAALRHSVATADRTVMGASVALTPHLTHLAGHLQRLPQDLHSELEALGRDIRVSLGSFASASLAASAAGGNGDLRPADGRSREVADETPSDVVGRQPLLQALIQQGPDSDSTLSDDSRDLDRR